MPAIGNYLLVDLNGKQGIIKNKGKRNIEIRAAFGLARPINI